MRKRDTFDVITAIVAVICDACAVFGGIMLATFIRFDSGWFTVPKGRPDSLYTMYGIGAAFATLIYILVFRAERLYVRPQIGSFVNKIPRIIKAVVMGTLLTTVLAFAVKNDFFDYSRLVIGLSVGTVAFFILLERYIMFRIEWNLARHSSHHDKVLILGTDSVAVHLKRTLEREPMMRCRVVGFLTIDDNPPHEDIPKQMILGNINDLQTVTKTYTIDQVILTSSRPGYERIVDILLFCEKELITFNMVPDIFNVMTASMDIYNLDDIPLLGPATWPLDYFWNRVLKRTEDIVGAIIGLIISAPIIAIAAIAIKKTSPGPVFYRQERCGRKGKVFTLYKLRTMRVDAEAETGPVFTRPNDPRTTRVGAFLRKYNLDELPQFWNVLRGDMSLVGPRPERPVFVSQFKEGIAGYMWRHVTRPGMTGWAQVNGLRGQTSIEERLKYDLYYLEHWTLAFDFKILVKTFFARKNAY
jgi:exopolysaccharide biosynthesis polyprenyl glycosylphosphotransferase